MFDAGFSGQDSDNLEADLSDDETTSVVKDDQGDREFHCDFSKERALTYACVLAFVSGRT
jgi:hypothetical protein